MNAATRGQEARDAFYRYFGADAAGGASIDEQHAPAWEAAAEAGARELREQLQAVRQLMEGAAATGIVDSRAVLALLADVPPKTQPVRGPDLEQVLGVLDKFTKDPEAAEKLGLGVIINLRRRTGLTPSDPTEVIDRAGLEAGRVPR